MDRREETGSALLSTAQGGLSNLAAKKMEMEQCSDMSPEEEELIHKLHSLLGDRWKLIAGRLPGRRAEEVERYWRMMEKGKSEEHNLYRPICVRLTPSFKFDMAEQFEEPEESTT